MRIDIFADIACPWCYIGERRLTKVVEMRPDLQIERNWRPFQLQPDMVASGLPWSQFVDTKFGGAQRADMMFANVVRAGEPDEINFRFDRMATAPNTRDAHRLVLAASERGNPWPMVEALYKAYFTNGRDLNNIDHLIALAAEADFSADDVRSLLAGNDYSEDVAQSQMMAGQLGIQGVPFYVIDERYGLSGAQPLTTLLQVIDQIAVQPSEV